VTLCDGIQHRLLLKRDDGTLSGGDRTLRRLDMLHLLLVSLAHIPLMLSTQRIPALL
jgi:hypothetical protein